MPTTRSATKKQSNVELQQDSSAKKAAVKGKSESKANNSPKANSSAKRKAAPESQKSAATKRAKPNDKTSKQSHFPEGSSTSLEKPIIINRSPVLQLWAATVANFLHPDESWNTCLSIGGSIATLCAISKGRAIGKVEPKDDSAEAHDKRKQRKQKDENFREIEVMGFTMQVMDDVVIVGGKPKPLNEDSLRAKFGGETNYDKTKNAMEEALQKWSDEKDELNKKAFHMYETFRPDIRSGASGWGRKGELNLQEVKSAAEK